MQNKSNPGADSTPESNSSDLEEHMLSSGYSMRPNEAYDNRPKPIARGHEAQKIFSIQKSNNDELLKQITLVDIKKRG